MTFANVDIIDHGSFLREIAHAFTAGVLSARHTSFLVFYPYVSVKPNVDRRPTSRLRGVLEYSTFLLGYSVGVEPGRDR
jgi:hypothetical protein